MPSNELRHFGVKGMRWGHRQASSDSSGSDKPKKVKPTAGQILDARTNVNNARQRMVLSNAAYVTARTSKGKTAAFKEFRAAEKLEAKNLDTSKKLLGREKAASVLAVASIALTTVSLLQSR